MTTSRMFGWVACALALGVMLTLTPAHARETLRLGAAISLTGKYATLGTHAKNGYDLVVERINARGGVTIGDTTYDLEIVYYDDESTPARAAQLVERLILQDEVQFMLGPYSSGITKAVAPVSEKYRIPMVEANGASRSLFTQGYRYLFATLATSENYLKSAIGLLAEQAEAAGRPTAELTVAGVFENDPFSLDIRAGVIEEVERFGMRLVIDDRLPPEINTMAPTLTKVRALSPDLLVVSGHAKGAALAVRQVSEFRVSVPMLAVTHCDGAQVIQKFGDKSAYILCPTQWAPSLTYEDPLMGAASQFAADFEAAYGYVPPYQGAQSGAAVLVYKDALERAGTIDRDAVRDALAETDLMTFFGPVRFDETGRNVALRMVLYQILDGEFQVVAPTRWAAAELVYPMPTWAER